MLRTRIWALLVLTIFCAAACGSPSYDLTVRVTEIDGTAIPQASVMLWEPQEVQVTDEAGQVAWTGIEQEYAILYVTADGYVAYAGKVDLERGNNETVIALEPEPEDPGPVGP